MVPELEVEMAAMLDYLWDKRMVNLMVVLLVQLMDYCLVLWKGLLMVVDLDLWTVYLLEILMALMLVVMMELSLGKGKVQHLVDIQASARHNKFARRSNHSVNILMFQFDLKVEHIDMQICHHIPRKQHLDSNLPHDSLDYDIDKDKGLLL